MENKILTPDEAYEIACKLDIAVNFDGRLNTAFVMFKDVEFKSRARVWSSDARADVRRKVVKHLCKEFYSTINK